MAKQKTTKGDHPDCPFCHLDDNREIIIESDLAYAIYDKFPVNAGHVLIIPKRHCADLFELVPGEQYACWQLINEVKKIITDHFHPDGFNIGINIGESAGQTIFHVHIHLIPRYKGDVEDPRGGIRGAIPEKMRY